MKEPKKFKYVSTICIFFVITLNCVLSCLAYSSYVDTIKDVILFNLPPNIISTVVRISYSLGLMFSIPIQISPMVDIIYRSEVLDEYVPLFKNKPVSKYYLGVLAVLLVCVLSAIFIPCLQMFINFSGALIGVFTLSIIPT
jgi:amino acid permease